MICVCVRVCGWVMKRGIKACMARAFAFAVLVDGYALDGLGWCEHLRSGV